MRLVLNYVWIKDQLVLGSQLSVSALTSYKTRPQLQVFVNSVLCLFVSCVFLLFPVDPFFFPFYFQNQSHSFMLSWHLFLYERTRVGLLIIWGEKGLEKKKKDQIHRVLTQKTGQKTNEHCCNQWHICQNLVYYLVTKMYGDRSSCAAVWRQTGLRHKQSSEHLKKNKPPCA